MGDDIVRIGYLTKSPPPGALKGWKRRFFCFKRAGAQGSTRLEYYPDSNMTSAKGVIALNDCNAVSNHPDIGKHKFLFQIVTSNRVYHLEASSEEERLMWVDTLSKELFQNPAPVVGPVPTQATPAMSASVPTPVAVTPVATASPPMPSVDAPRRTSISYKRAPSVEKGKKLERPYHPQPENSFFPWLYGPISRQDTERLMADYGKPSGLFLLRRKGADQYAISVCTSGNILHHLVKQIGGTFYLNERPLTSLTSIEEVVDYLATPKSSVAWKHSLSVCPKDYDARIASAPAIPPSTTTAAVPATASTAPPALQREFTLTVLGSADTQVFGVSGDQACLLVVTATTVSVKDTATGIPLASWPIDSIYDYGFDSDTFFFKSNSAQCPGHFKFIGGDPFDIVSTIRGFLPPQKGPKSMSVRAPAAQRQAQQSKFSTLTAKKAPPAVVPRKQGSLTDIVEDPIDPEVLTENSGKPLPPATAPKSKFDANFLSKVNTHLAQPPTMRPKSHVVSPPQDAGDAGVSAGMGMGGGVDASKRVSVQNIGVAMVGSGVDIGAALSNLKKTSTMPRKSPPAIPQQDQPQEQAKAPMPVVQEEEKPVAPLQRQEAVPEVEGVLYLAGCDYDPAGAPGKLAFKEGDIINVVKAENDSWWLGVLNGKRGWVPASYMDPLPEDDEILTEPLDEDDEETMRALAALNRAQSFTSA